MVSQAKPFLTPERYLEIDRQAEQKSEYIGGEMIAMAGASFAHNLIVANVVGELRTQLRGKDCRAVASDLRVQIRETGMFAFPDVVVTCGRPEFADGHSDILLNPIVLMEVLSPATEAYDRGEKFAHYRRRQSLQEYILISQSRARVERYVRQAEGHWLFSETEGLEAILSLTSIDCVLPLSSIYEQVELPRTDPGQDP